MKTAARLSVLLLFACLLALGGTSGTAAASDPGSVLNDMDGRVHDLNRTFGSGRTAVLVFWQTWCPSCRAEAPKVAAAAKAHAASADFFGIVPGPDGNVDNREVREVAKRWGYDFPQVRDPDLELTRIYNVTLTPTLIVLGPGGKTLYRGNREPKDWAAVLKTPTGK